MLSAASEAAVAVASDAFALILTNLCAFLLSLIAAPEERQVGLPGGPWLIRKNRGAPDNDS
jgi:hypothetical protein